MQNNELEKKFQRNKFKNLIIAFYLQTSRSLKSIVLANLAAIPSVWTVFFSRLSGELVNF